MKSLSLDNVCYSAGGVVVITMSEDASDERYVRGLVEKLRIHYIRRALRNTLHVIILQ